MTRGQYAKTSLTREQALAAVLETVAEHGLSTMSIQQIADSIGLTKQGLLYHFGSREKLLLAVIQRSDEMNAFDSPVSDTFAAFIDIDAHNMQVPGLLALYLGLVGSAASQNGDTLLRRAFKERYETLRGSLVENIISLQKRREIRDDIDPLHIANLMIAASDGVQLQWLLDDSVPVIESLRSLQLLLAPRVQ